MVLVIVSPDAAPEVQCISDYDGIYAELPETRAEVVVVEQNEVTKMVFLKGVSGISFYDKDKPCPAWVAIESALATDPVSLYKAMLSVV